MNLSKLTAVASRTGLVIKKYSPQILTYGGIAGVVVAGVWAAKNTLKLEDEIDGLQADLKHVETLSDDITPTELRNQRIFAYSKGITRISGLYVAPVALGTVSIACIVSGHTILARRNVALTAAYAALQKSYAEYKDRVVKQLGLDGEAELMTITETKKVADENGQEQEVTETTIVGRSPYAKVFDETNRNWMSQPEFNLVWLKNQQNFANDLLQARGHVFLNEIYDMLGLDHTPAGAVTGWVKGNGDNFIDFGIYDSVNTDVLGHPAAMRPGPHEWHLDFNVDGVVYDLIGKSEK